MATVWGRPLTSTPPFALRHAPFAAEDAEAIRFLTADERLLGLDLPGVIDARR